MNTCLKSLMVLGGLRENAVFGEFCRRLEGEADKSALFASVYAAGAETGFLAYVQKLILCDENAFSKSCARGAAVSKYLKKAYLDDLDAILNAVLTFDCEDRMELGEPLEIFNDGNAVEKLTKFYAENGYGKFIFGRAFTYANGKLEPVANPSGIRLGDLKEYENEKRAVLDDVCDFINGYPYSHALLYGDRGTGKSSTVHAVLNELHGRGLRLVEINADNLLSIPAIREEIRDNPLKFILFIDDLSLEENDEKLSPLKTAFEGSVDAGAGNALIIATSNRRHVIKESFAGREGAVHASDAIDEQLSLSDRFGLKILFSPTDKAAYLSIVEQLCEDMRLTTDKQKLLALAERWAIVKGGRSPRHARQFADFVYSCERSGRAIDF